MSQITTLEKQNKNKPITDSKIKIKIKEFIHPIMLMLSKTKIKYKINKVNKYNSISGKPIIFAINHTNCNDIPIACNAIKEHGYLLIGKQGLEKMDEIFFNLNGVIYVDRKNKDDTTLSKDAMCSYLKKNKNLIVFPEGTWNLTDNLLMLNMKWGIVDIARDADAQIIPVVLDYDDKNMVCSAKFGEPIVADNQQNKKEIIGRLRDSMATLRWEFLEKKGVFEKTPTIGQEFAQRKQQYIEEYEKLDIEYEKSVVFNPHISNEEVFTPIKKIGCSPKTAFMYGKNKKGNW